MSRSIFRCVDCIILRCSLVGVHVPDCVADRRSYHCVEQPESMFQHVVFRCQFLPALVKCRPGSPDSISDFGRLLLRESNHLAKNLTLSPLVIISTFMSSTSISFLVRAVVAENFCLFWMNPEAHFLSYFLEFTQHFPYLFFGCCEQLTSLGKSQVREAVMIVVAPIVEFRPSVSIEELC